MGWDTDSLGPPVSRVEVELYTAGYRVSGHMSTRFRRVGDILNLSSSTHLVVDEATREAIPNPVERVLRDGVVTGLANNRLLVSRDRTRLTPIDDSGAPIRGPSNTVEGVVLVFRDVTARKSQQARLCGSLFAVPCSLFPVRCPAGKSLASGRAIGYKAPSS